MLSGTAFFALAGFARCSRYGIVEPMNGQCASALGLSSSGASIFAMLVVVAASAYMVWAAISLMVLTGPLQMTATSLPMPLLYGAVFVGYLMILGHTVLNIVMYLRHPDEIPDAVEKAAAMEGL